MTSQIIVVSVLDFESRSFSDLALSASRLGQYVFAVVAGDDGLGVAEDNVGFIAASALDIHEV